MLPATVRTDRRTEIRRRRPHRETRRRAERVLDPERERERITGLRVEDVLHHDAVGLALPDSPACPADEAVDRVRGLGLAEGQLVPLPVELVATVLDPVRPRTEHLASPRGGLLLEPVAVEDVPAVHRVGPKPAADLDNDRPLVPERDLVLLARRRERHTIPPHAIRSRRWSPTRSEFAIAVRAGLTAPMLGKMLVSTT